MVIRVPNAGFFQRTRRQMQEGKPGGALKLLGYNNLLGLPYLRGYTPRALYRLLRANGFGPIAVHNSSLLTPPYPDMSTRIRKEWRAVRATGEARVAPDGSWLEVVSRRIA